MGSSERVRQTSEKVLGQFPTFGGSQLHDLTLVNNSPFPWCIVDFTWLSQDFFKPSSSENVAADTIVEKGENALGTFPTAAGLVPRTARTTRPWLFLLFEAKNSLNAHKIEQVRTL